MDEAGWILVAVYSIIVCIAFLRHFIYRKEMQHTTFLSPDDSVSIDPNEAPLISILVPAKDEEKTIAACIESLLQQTYPNYEILIIDDRSDDSTATIVKQFADRHEKVRLIQIEELPSGWTGKNHALHYGRQQAAGDWYFFVDADTKLHPQATEVLFADAAQHQSDLLSLLPSLETNSFWEKTVQPFAGICLMFFYPLSRVNDSSNPDSGFANGQCILIRKQAYEKIRGHEAVKDKFVEDIHLGRNVRKAGLNLRVVMAPDLVTVRMYSSLSLIVRGWSRILYSAVDHKASKLIGLIFMMSIFSLAAPIAIGTSAIMLWFVDPVCPILWSIFVLGFLHEIAQTTLFAKIYRNTRSDLKYLGLRWVAVCVMLYVCMKTIRMCYTHQVSWRGTTYDQSIQH